ncbi:MAG TPA: DUF3090 family protein [Acidimicrobiales bacterium]|nr:DUF3090 family protein [Acidimicrobiales bacterium]
MSKSFDLPAVQRLTVGTVGPVGKRAFYLQARQGDQLVTLKVEKQQVGALSQLLSELLEDLPTVGELPTDEALELEEPVLAEWPVGTMRIDYDRDADQVILVAEEVTAVDEEGGPEETGSMARFGATREQVAALVQRGAALVEAGRPPCPLCGYPLDPGGHSCPRTNGHRPPTL